MRKFLELCRCPQLIVSCLSSPTHQDLKLAIKKSQIYKLQSLLQEGAPTHQKNHTILHFAVSQNKLDIVQFICQKQKTLIDQRNDDGDTPFMLSIFAGQNRTIKYLINVSNVNMRDNNGNTPFIIAAANGNLIALQLLLQNAKTNVMVKNFEGQNALHRAAYNGQIEVINLLIKHTRLRFSNLDKKGNNCLHLACMGLSLKCCRFILMKMKQSYKLIQQRNKDDKKPLQILQEMIEKVNIGKKSQKLNINKKELYDYILGNDCEIQI